MKDFVSQSYCDAIVNNKGEKIISEEGILDGARVHFPVFTLYFFWLSYEYQPLEPGL